MCSPEAKQWYLVKCKPRKDELAEKNLLNQEFVIYRPLAMRLRKRRGKLVKTTESLFPSYLFIHLDSVSDNWSPIRSTIGVSKIVEFGGVPARVPNEIIQLLQHEHCDLAEKAIDLDRYKQGDRVIPTDGPFKGISGQFLSYDGEERAIILLEIMHKHTKLGISPAKLMAA